MVPYSLDANAEFRTYKSGAVTTARNQHLAIAQQGRGVSAPARDETAGGSPDSLAASPPGDEWSVLGSRDMDEARRVSAWAMGES
jgi:chaperone required for assembly of F1-ATPase